MGLWVRNQLNSLVRLVLMRLLSTPYLAGHYVPFIPYRRLRETYLIPRTRPAPTSDPRTLPIPPRDLWEGYGATSEAYLEMGREHVAAMERVLETGGAPLASASRILDFGCAAGRMTRWLFPLAAEREIWGVDLNSEYIYWARSNLTPPFRFLTTTSFPHLPFEDRYFDLVYAGSVFTHIDDMAAAWFAELARVLRPGGMLYITICDRAYSKLLHLKFRGKPVEHEFLKYRTYPRYVESDFASFVLGRGMLSLVFYDREYLREFVRPFFEIVAFNDESYGIQTVALLQKRA
jgi:SAM-dependent methyltransferase